MTLQEMIQKLPEAFVPEEAAGLDCRIQLNDIATIVIADGACNIEDAGGAADLTLNMEEADMMAMFQGELDGMTAFTTGKLEMDGDPMLAMRMEGLFDADKVS